ncbi:hypothetical protein [Gordonia phage GTE5]|uniref:Uncharacterized protein n=1 Tax=Gordonia phage GTE5 TaxID=319522 RepID=G8EJU6_9CAUD|nr:hypothetical protein GoPhGTE5p79 [Gordonia phage GTE5]AET09828.1 hypothetical protein [Gordonia phage GTE5]
MSATHVIACQVWDDGHAVRYYAIDTDTRDTVGGPYPDRETAERFAAERSADGPMIKPLPATGLYRAMDSGHRNRHGHGLLAHLESTDGGALWSVVTDCCRPAAD